MQIADWGNTATEGNEGKASAGRRRARLGWSRSHKYLGCNPLRKFLTLPSLCGIDRTVMQNHPNERGTSQMRNAECELGSLFRPHPCPLPQERVVRAATRLRIGEGPGCISRPSVRPGCMPLAPLQATYFIYDKKRTASERDGRMGRSSLIFAYSRLSSLNGRKIMEAQGHTWTSMDDHGRSTTDCGQGNG